MYARGSRSDAPSHPRRGSRRRLTTRAVAVLTALLATAATAGQPPAETVGFGLRFVVDGALASSPARQEATRSALARMVSELNGYYRDSQVVLRAEVVGLSFVRLASREATVLLRDMEQQRNGFGHMFACADEIGADYTIAVSDGLTVHGRRGCGRGFAVNSTPAQIASSRRAFAVIDFACGSQTLAHELGHLMGLNHGALVDQCQPGRGHRTAIAPYANGFAAGYCDGRPDPGEFGTIMVGGWMRAITGEQKNLPLYSNPRLRDPRCGASGVCGDPEIGDEARALNENARTYAAHEEPDEPEPASGICR